MDIFALFSFNSFAMSQMLIAFFLLLQGMIVIIQNPKKPLHRSFFLFELATFIWLFFMSLGYMANDAHIAHILVSIGFIGVMYIPITTYAFSVYFTDSKKQQKIIIFGLIATILCTLLLANGNFSESAYRYPWGYYIHLGRLSLLAVSLFIIFIPLFINNLYIQYSRAQYKQKKRHFLALFAGILAFFGIFDFLPSYGVYLPFPPPGYLFVGIFATLMSYYIVRYRLVDITIIFGRTLGHIILTIILLLIYVSFLVNLQQLGSTAHIILSGIFFILIFYIFSFLKDKSQRMIDELFYKEKINLDRLVARFSSNLRDLRNPSLLYSVISDFFTHELRINTPVVGIIHANEMQMRLYRDTSKNVYYEEIQMMEECQKYFTQNSQALLVDEVTGNEDISKKVIDIFQPFKPVLIIPLVKNNILIGFLALGKKQSEKGYVKDEINIFENLAVSLGIAWENSEHYEKIQQESKIKSDFISVISHIMRTPVSNARWIFESFLNDKYFQTRQDQRHLLQNGLSSIKTMNELMQKFVDLTRIEGGNLQIKNIAVNILHIIKEVESEMKNVLAQKNINVVYKNNKDVFILADELYLRSVIYILMQNAVDYSKNNSAIAIDIKEAKDHTIIFSITDEGIGIVQVDQKNIFNQFFRAQNAFDYYPNGTGLGLFYAKKIVQLMKGSIWFRSRVNIGTSFYCSFKSAMNLS